jgi:hypothetical protein
MITTTNCICYYYEDVTYLCEAWLSASGRYLGPIYISGSSVSSGSDGTTGCSGDTGPTGAELIKIPAPRRILPSNMIINLSRQMRWLSLLRENNSRRG